MFRPAVSALLVPVLTGCGFALAFGWLWFGGLRLLWLGEIAVFFPLCAYSAVFSLLMGALCILFGLGAAFLGKGRRKQTTVLAHGGGLLCLCLACLAAEDVVVCIALFGLAGAFLGTYWIHHLLRLEPFNAVLALAWASGAAACMSGLAAALPRLTPTGFMFSLAGCILAAWLLAAAGERLSFFNREEQNTTLPPPLWKPRFLVISGVLALFFFALGVMGATSASPPAPLPTSLAHLTGALLAVPAMRRIFFQTTYGETMSRLSMAGICALAVMAFCLFFESFFSLLVLDAGSGFSEAVCLTALITGIRARTPRLMSESAWRVAGFSLAALLLAVNLGNWAGGHVFAAFGARGLSVLTAILILPFAAVWFWTRQNFFRTPSLESAPLLALSAGGPWQEAPFAVTQDTVTDPPAESIRVRDALSVQLSARELDVASLIVQGYTNKSIAKSLSITEGAVRWHIKNLNKKTGVTDRAQLIEELTGQ